MGFRIKGDQLGVVVEHFFKVRDFPFRIYGIAGEAAADLIVDPAHGHLPEGQVYLRFGFRIMGAAEVTKQETVVVGQGEFRCTVRPALAWIEATLPVHHHFVDSGHGEFRMTGLCCKLLHLPETVHELIRVRAGAFGIGEVKMMQADQQIFPLRSREVRAAVNRTAVGQGKAVGGQPPPPVMSCTADMYTWSTSGRSSRSTLMQTKCSFISLPTASCSKLCRSMTWHQ